MADTTKPLLQPEQLPGVIKQVALLVEMGMPASPVIEGLLGRALLLEDRRWLDGPVLVHEASGWTAKDVAPFLYDQARAERVEIVLGFRPGLIVGPSEISAIMHAASLAAPLNHRDSELYYWASGNAIARRDKKPVEEVAAMLGWPIPTDADVLSRSSGIGHAYRELAHDARAKVIRHQEGRERTERRAARADQVPLAAE